jgi:hypothetical protein
MKGNREASQQFMTGPSSESTVGLDLGDRWSRYCAIDSRGVVVKEDRVRTRPEALEETFRLMLPRCPNRSSNRLTQGECVPASITILLAIATGQGSGTPDLPGLRGLWVFLPSQLFHVTITAAYLVAQLLDADEQRCQRQLHRRRNQRCHLAGKRRRGTRWQPSSHRLHQPTHRVDQLHPGRNQSVPSAHHC